MQATEPQKLSPKPVVILAGVACSFMMVAIGAPMGIEGDVVALCWLFLVLFSTGLLVFAIRKRILRYYRAAAWMMWLSGVISFLAVLAFT